MSSNDVQNAGRLCGGVFTPEIPGKQIQRSRARKDMKVGTTCKAAPDAKEPLSLAGVGRRCFRCLLLASSLSNNLVTAKQNLPPLLGGQIPIEHESIQRNDASHKIRRGVEHAVVHQKATTVVGRLVH